MSDDLVSRLRRVAVDGWNDGMIDDLCDEAADALEAKEREIEKLTHERNAARSQLQVHLHNAEVARE